MDLKLALENGLSQGKVAELTDEFFFLQGEQKSVAFQLHFPHPVLTAFRPINSPYHLHLNGIFKPLTVIN